MKLCSSKFSFKVVPQITLEARCHTGNFFHGGLLSPMALIAFKLPVLMFIHKASAHGTGISLQLVNSEESFQPLVTSQVT